MLPCSRSVLVPSSRNRLRSANQGFQARDQCPWAEGLGEEIIGAGLKDPDFVLFIAPGGENDDRKVLSLRPRSKVRQDAVSVQPWQVQVEDNDVRRTPIHFVQRHDSVSCLHDVEAVVLEKVAQHQAEGGLVFDKKHCMSAGRSLAAEWREIVDEFEDGLRQER